MSQKPENPYRPYDDVHKDTKGPGDARPTALQIVKDCNAIGKLKGKTILITGCTAGLGIETAKALYETGAQLYVTGRDIPKLNKIIDDIVSNGTSKDTPRPEPLELHLDSLDAVRKAAEDFKKRSSQLNILICNAGVMACPYSKTKDGFELQLGTNHFAHFLLFQLLKPTLLSSAAASNTTSRVITVSSAGHRYGGIRFDDLNFTPETYQKWTAYGQSKTANIYMASSIDRHYGAQNLHALSLHPGGIKTELSRHMEQSELDAMGINDRLAHIFKSPAQGAATQVWAAVSEHFEGKNGGRYLAECAECGPMQEGAEVGADGYGPHVYQPELEERLWKLSYEAVGLPVED